MLTLNDGRSELWQWDTGRTLTVDADCSQVHFSNKVFGRSIDVDVIDGVAIIPDILLQTDRDLIAWAFVGTTENGYTKISKVFKVNKRNKPADYVFTPPEQTTLAGLVDRLNKIEENQDPDAIKNAVEDYLEQNPVEAPVQSVNGQTGEVKLTAKDVGAISQDDLQEATNKALEQAKASGEFDGKDGKDGADGYTPQKNVDYFDGRDGVDGQDGKDGQPGANGQDGSPGADGKDGTTPHVGSNGNWFIGENDTGIPATGPAGGQGLQGTPGEDGKDGVSATHSWNGTVLTITSASGTSSADLKGAKGDQGEKGADGAKGDKGDQGIQGIQGEKGDKGDTGATGANGKDGTNGTSVTVKSVSESTVDGGNNVVTFSDGKTLTVKNGSKGSTGATGSPGSPGADGKTPVRGVDYYTEEDKSEFSEYIASELAKRGQLKPEFANSIAECTDTTKLYVLPDGYIYAYMLTETEPEPLFTNWLPKAIKADGTPYIGDNGEKGYRPGYRVSSNGSEKAQTFDGYACTGFIPAKPGDVIRVKNVDTMRSSPEDDCAHCTVCHYDASFSRIGATMQYWNEMPVSADGTVTMTLNLSGAVYIRTSLKNVTEDSILTINEEIAYSSGGTGYAWANTGHAFIPADYEERIVALENNVNDVKSKLDFNGNILYGKKWVACGDSFTYKGYTTEDGFDESVYKYQDGRFVGKNIVYPYIIGLRNNMDIVNLATGGQTMAASDNSFMTRYATIDADADYITLMFGINDKGLGLALGTLEDSTNATFCGAFNIAMEHILVNHPFAHVGIMVSTGTSAEYMQATRDIAERWGVPYLDFGSPQVPLMHGYTGRNVCEKAKEIREQNFRVSSSNMHPNTAAHEYESTFIEAWLRTL